MKTLWILSGLLLFFSFRVKAEFTVERCEANFGSCSYYDCLGEEFQCAPTSFVRKTAAPYCRYYQQSEPDFTLKGQKVLEKLKVCIQEQIRVKASKTCDKIDKDFVNAHVTCYLSQGFCGLSLMDKWRIGRVGLAKLGHQAFLKAAIKIVNGCGDRDTASVLRTDFTTWDPAKM